MSEHRVVFGDKSLEGRFTHRLISHIKVIKKIVRRTQKFMSLVYTRMYYLNHVSHNSLLISAVLYFRKADLDSKRLSGGRNQTSQRLDKKYVLSESVGLNAQL